MIELYAWIPPFVSAVSVLPVASLYARHQARSSDRVANLRHERVHLDTLARFLLPLLDGTRTRDDLARILDELVAAGRLKVTDDPSGEADATETLDRVHRELDASLGWLARPSLLVG